MDKLRALKYLTAAAGQASFSGAARQLDVSVQAVAKLITELEKDLGIRLFERTHQGLTLTPAGTSYLEACGPALMQLDDADEQARAMAERLKGTLVVGVQHVIARGCLTEALPRFHARHPDIELDIRAVEHEAQTAVPGVHVMLVLGWPQVKDLVCRRVAAGRYMVVASPAYWATHGTPSRPKELERHVCLTFRGIDGMAMDVWNFKRGHEHESVIARGWLTTSHAHRDLPIELALAGHGVLRVLDWINRREVVSGGLVEVLKDWEATEVVPVNILYGAGARRMPTARAFIDFVTDLFREIESARGGPVVGTERPAWMRRTTGRASDVAAGYR